MTKGDPGLAAALMGDEAFFKAIDEADPDTYGCNCSGCDEYFVGKLSELDPSDACCPSCGSTRFSLESPALGSGNPAAKRKDRS